jgi:rod shape determining protein RodA
MFDRRLVQYFDWGMLIFTLVLGTIGILTLYSAVSSGGETPQRILYIRQLIWFGIGLMAMVACFLFNYKALDRWAPVIYGACILMLLWVLFFGKYVGGSRRWISLGPASVQPSELVKVALIICLARYYSRAATPKGFTLRQLVTPIVLTLVPFILIVRQPDLGTAMLLLLIAGSMTVFVKIERRSMIALVSAGTIAVPLVWFFLKEYQKRRILTFLNPDRDPLGAGYHVIQSKIAIGSGQIVGKGFLKGTQNALAFLPEQHTDFIFSVLAEEWGFIGSMGLLLLFLLMIVWSLNIAVSSRDPFGTVLAVGVTSMIFWQVFINIGMVMGLMPVVGVPLPLVSYGGSSIITIMVSIGLLMNVSMRRFLFE